VVISAAAPDANGVIEFTFTNPIQVNEASTCSFTFDTQIAGISADASPLVIQTAAAFGTGGVDPSSVGVCNNENTGNAGGTSAVNIEFTCSAAVDKQVDCGAGFVDVTGGDDDATNTLTKGCLAQPGDTINVQAIVSNTGDTDIVCDVLDDGVLVQAGVEITTEAGSVTLPLATAACSEVAGMDTVTLENCACLGGEVPGTADPASDSLFVECCGLTLDKQVTCPSGTVDVTGGDDADGTSTQTCITWLDMPDDPVSVSYSATPNGTTEGASLTECTLSETNALLIGGSPVDVPDLATLPSFGPETCTERSTRPKAARTRQR
jgi:hypothetical protein